LPRSARPAKLQLETQAKNPIWRPIQVIAAIATAMARTARMTAQAIAWMISLRRLKAGR
jgi:hypothetical protein